VLAATDCLAVTYSGRDERTNAERPPAVPVGELLDVIDRTVTTGEIADDGRPVAARERVVVHHPLQPFDVRNFTVGALVPDWPWSFDPIALDGARAVIADRVAAPFFLTEPLPDVVVDPIEIDQLVRFVQHPVRAFLRQRLGITVGDRSESPGDELPIELDQLEEWGVGQRLLEARLGGADSATSVAAEIARGILPPGALAHPILDRVGPVVAHIVEAARALARGGGEPGSVEVNLRVPSGRAIVGTVPDVSGNLLRTVTYSRIGPRHRLTAWVRLLALTAVYPERPFEAATVGKGRSGRAAIARIPALDPDLAIRQLGLLLELYDRGQREPLPLYCRTSAAYAEAEAAGKDSAAAGRRAWESSWDYDKEDKEPEHLLVLGGVRSFDELLAAADVRGNGAAVDEPGRFGRYARQLWDGLLSCEMLGHRSDPMPSDRSTPAAPCRRV
jgi:exodeoxyribonuclease V gamma subunit